MAAKITGDAEQSDRKRSQDVRNYRSGNGGAYPTRLWLS